MILGIRIAFLFLMLASPEAFAQAEPGQYEHWEGKYFACLIPNRNWMVSETEDGIDIRDSGGSLIVRFGCGTGAPTPMNTNQVAMSCLPALGISNVRFVRQGDGAPGGGGTSQDFEFTGIRAGVEIRGAIVATVLAAVEGGNRYSVSVRLAPADLWTAASARLETIQKSIVLLRAKPRR